jgi:RNA polymerase sigma-70 factor (ECF subfamily)
MVTHSEIEEAVNRVRDGDLDDYRIVVRAFHQRLRGALAGLCPPAVDPDEIVHLTFVEAYRSLARYRPGSDFFAWLCAIARFRLLTECKRLRRQLTHQQTYAEQLLSERVMGLTESEVKLTDLRLQWLRECIAQLKPDAQSLLDQRYGRREPIEAMAGVLGRSASAIRVQLFVLRKKLRECVERKWGAFRLADS